MLMVTLNWRNDETMNIKKQLSDNAKKLDAINKRIDRLELTIKLLETGILLILPVSYLLFKVMT